MDGISAKPTDTSQILGTKVALQPVAHASETSDSSAQPVEASEKKVKLTEEELKELTKQLNKELGSKDLDVKFAYDEKLEELYVMVYEHDSEKIVRKIPSEDAMNLSIKMKEIAGTLLDKNA